MNETSVKQPLFRMIKRDDVTKSQAMCVRLIAVLLSLIVCAAIITGITGESPVNVYLGIINGAFGNPNRIWVTIRETAVLLLIAVGLTPAFRMKFWNIGAEGQILMGGLVSAAWMIYGAEKMPNSILLIFIIISSAAAGMIWGVVPAVFKAYMNTNETLFTLMLNYVAMQIINYAIVFWEKPSGSNTVGIINSASKAGWFPKLLGGTYGLNVLLVLIVTVLVTIYMRRSRQGFELSVVGESSRTAEYVKINVKRVIIRTMMISGAICGLAGAVIVSGSSHTISTSTAGGRGFTAIVVAWMSQFNPIAMLVVSAFFVFMQQGAIQIATQFGLNENASDIITGIILFFMIGAEYFVQYKFRFGRKKEA